MKLNENRGFSDLKLNSSYPNAQEQRSQTLRSPSVTRSTYLPVVR